MDMFVILVLIVSVAALAIDIGLTLGVVHEKAQVDTTIDQASGCVAPHGKTLGVDQKGRAVVAIRPGKTGTAG